MTIITTFSKGATKKRIFRITVPVARVDHDMRNNDEKNWPRSAGSARRPTTTRSVRRTESTTRCVTPTGRPYCPQETIHDLIAATLGRVGVIALLALMFLFAISAERVADGRRLNGSTRWFFAGLVLGPFGLLWAFVSSPPGKLCPHCAEKLRPEATICRFCNAALAAS